VDHNLWTTNVPAPSAKFITGTKPDGSPSYMLYDPNGESTRGLPQPRYGELKNFGYVPKPGQVCCAAVSESGRCRACGAMLLLVPVAQQHLLK
jgi:hypothetical protein